MKHVSIMNQAYDTKSTIEPNTGVFLAKHSAFFLTEQIQHILSDKIGRERTLEINVGRTVIVSAFYF